MGLGSLFSPVYKHEKSSKNMKKHAKKPSRKRHITSGTKSDKRSVKSGKSTRTGTKKVRGSQWVRYF